MDESRVDVTDAAQGDREALERLLIRYIGPLRGFVRLNCGPTVRAKESCSDLVQSVCREALADLDGFEYRGEAAFRHWLFQRAHRKILGKNQFLQREKRDVRREVAAPTGEDGDEADLLAAYGTFCTPSVQLQSHEAIARIEAAVDALPEAQREAVLLHRLVGMDYKEIAEATGRAEGAIRTNVYRGLAQLGLELSAASEEDG